jgi:hypothetical protein
MYPKSQPKKLKQTLELKPISATKSKMSLQNSQESEREEDLDMDDSVSTDLEDDIEEQLKHLSEFSNDKQLKLLRKEIDHIIIHNLQPSEGWYDERFAHIYQYSTLNWSNICRMFYNRDEYIYTTASNIINELTDLIESRYTKPNFDIRLYQKVIHDVDDIWLYYDQVYIKEDAEPDILDLIDGIKNLAK